MSDGHGGTMMPPSEARDGSRPRLRMLLSEGRWHGPSFAEQLPRLLEPMGVHCVRAGSADDASRVIRSTVIHIAVVDLTIPLSPAGAATGPAGPRVLQLLRRLEAPPPVIVVRPAQWSHRDSCRTLAEALREGAFAVLDRPVPLEAMLEALRRLIRRHYRDHWPQA